MMATFASIMLYITASMDRTYLSPLDAAKRRSRIHKRLPERATILRTETVSAGATEILRTRDEQDLEGTMAGQISEDLH